MAVLPVGVWGLHVPAEAGPVPAISEDIGDVRSDALVTVSFSKAIHFWVVLFADAYLNSSALLWPLLTLRRSH